MVTCFGPETIYKNAFYNVPGLQLTKGDIVRFCDILRAEVTKSSNPNYKYIYFDFNQRELALFYENYFGTFNIIGDNIYLSSEITQEILDHTNMPYDDYIKECLFKTRQQFLIDQ